MEYSAQLNVPKIENPFEFDLFCQEQPSENILLELPPMQANLFEPNLLPLQYYHDHVSLSDIQDFEDFSSGLCFDNYFSSPYCEDIMVDEKPQTNLGTSFVHNNENPLSEVSSEVSRMIEREIFGNLGKNNEVGITRCGRKRDKLSMELELNDIQKYFEMPIKEAAKELRVGVTRLKKRCRELNIMRWPHRKFKSLEYLINNVKKMGLNRNEIMMLEEQKRLLEEAPDMELTEKAKRLRQACFKANYKYKRSLALANRETD